MRLDQRAAREVARARRDLHPARVRARTTGCGAGSRTRYGRALADDVSGCAGRAPWKGDRRAADRRARTRAALAELRGLVARGGVVVLSGAGLSTESGIPDYRGPTGSLRRHSPMTYQAFVGSPAARRRYWARSYLGWRQIADGAAERRAPRGGRAAAARAARRHHHAERRRPAPGRGRAATSSSCTAGSTSSCAWAAACATRRCALDERLRAANPDFGARVDRGQPRRRRRAVRRPSSPASSRSAVPLLLLRPAQARRRVLRRERAARPRVDACYALVEAARRCSCSARR